MMMMMMMMMMLMMRRMMMMMMMMMPHNACKLQGKAALMSKRMQYKKTCIRSQ